MESYGSDFSEIFKAMTQERMTKEKTEQARRKEISAFLEDKAKEIRAAIPEMKVEVPACSDGTLFLRLSCWGNVFHNMNVIYDVADDRLVFVYQGTRYLSADLAFTKLARDIVQAMPIDQLLDTGEKR